MASSALITIELFLVLGAVTAWGAYELWSLKRERKRDAMADARKKTEAENASIDRSSSI